MSTNSNAPAAGQESMITKAEHDAAVNAAREEGLSAGRAEGELTGAKAAQARIGGILKCDEAKGRETLAHHLAFATSTSLEDAKATLAASPAAPAAHASGRAKDSASGLATSDVQDKPEPKAKAPVAIDRGGVYKKFSGGQ